MRTQFEYFLSEAIEGKHPRVTVGLAHSLPVTLSAKERSFLMVSNIEFQPFFEEKTYPGWSHGIIWEN